MSGGKTWVRRRGNVSIPNETVYDDRLSYAALGVLVAALGKPNGASHGYRSIMKRGLGQVAAQKALKELDEAGYRHMFRRSTGKGFVFDTIISEVPISSQEAHAWYRKQVEAEDAPKGSKVKKSAPARASDSQAWGSNASDATRASDSHAWSGNAPTPRGVDKDSFTPFGRKESEQLPRRDDEAGHDDPALAEAIAGFKAAGLNGRALVRAVTEWKSEQGLALTG